MSLITLLKVVLQQLTEFNQQIAKLFASLPDAELFQALPGAGPHLAPRLLVAFGEDRTRFTSAQAFMSYIGIAPVKEESGKKCSNSKFRLKNRCLCPGASNRVVHSVPLSDTVNSFEWVLPLAR
ncbi:transposase [Leptothoe sp. EHU-05/26/07-4]